MEPLKNLIERAWEGLTEGWRELLTRGGGALTHFSTEGTRKDEVAQEFPHWILRWFYPTTGNFIAVVGRYSDGALVKSIQRSMRTIHGLRVCSLKAPQWLTGVDFSDHRNYWSHGYNAVMVSVAHTVATATIKAQPYDAVNDFAPVGVVANSAFVVVVRKDFPDEPIPAEPLPATVLKAQGLAD